MKRLLCFPQTLMKPIIQRYSQYAGLPQAIVSIRQQSLYVFRNLNFLAVFPVSTSRYGVGSNPNSLCTPLGVHRVYKKIGTNTPTLMCFVGRVAQNIATLNPFPTVSYKDAICTRIIWLASLQTCPARKFLDSQHRYIYIHGTIDEKRVGRPASSGCIRMRNSDVCSLFSVLQENSLVHIVQ